MIIFQNKGYTFPLFSFTVLKNVSIIIFGGRISPEKFLCRILMYIILRYAVIKRPMAINNGRHDDLVIIEAHILFEK